jgi:hypothetical protein
VSTLTRAAEKLRLDPLPLFAELSTLLALIDDYDCPAVVVEAAERTAREVLADPGDVPEVVA